MATVDTPLTSEPKKHSRPAIDSVSPSADSDSAVTPANSLTMLSDTAKAKGIDWPIVGWLVLVHAGIFAAPFTFTWEALLVTLGLHWLTGGIGICLGYHRLFTHGSFKTYRPVRWVLAVLGGLAGEGSVVDWVSNHRKHHALSDQEGDPHSPRDGSWWSHMFWLAPAKQPAEYAAHVKRWAPDLAKDPVLVWIGRMFLPSHFVMAGLLFGAGYLLGGWAMAWSLTVWGSFVRLAFVLHSTWFVNSASHMWGYENYESGDDSRNNWWVALITYGEGWHNNHHAYPRMANHGHRWWEFDVTFRTIRLMQWVGLAWKVVDYKQKKIADAKVPQAASRKFSPDQLVTLPPAPLRIGSQRRESLKNVEV